MRGLVRAIDALSRFFGATAAVLVIILVVLMLYDVVLRYALNAPTTWGNDMNTWLGSDTMRRQVFVANSQSLFFSR